MYKVASFYKFKEFSAEQVEDLKLTLRKVANEHRIEGLFLLATEGVNSTFCGSEKYVTAFIERLKIWFGPELDFKFSYSEKRPFYSLRVTIKQEIVTSWHDGAVKTKVRNHLSAEEWNKMMSQEDIQIVDTRNYYEFELGHFNGAINPSITHFVHLPEAVDSLNLDKDKPTLIYCTGGIRCEKAIDAFEDKGFKSVYQLDGGILNYFEKTSENKFVGECFVFDDRVAVDANMQPSNVYVLCSMCGQPGSEITPCSQCGDDAKVCLRCIEANQEVVFCSKNCAHHFKLKSEQSGAIA